MTVHDGELDVLRYAAAFIVALGVMMSLRIPPPPELIFASGGLLVAAP